MSRWTRHQWIVAEHGRRKSRRYVPFRRRLGIEPLEDRRMLAVFTVTNLDDLPVAAANDAPGTLRQAIFDANDTPGADTIEFDSSLTSGGPATITLYYGQLSITDDLTITGPGADLLTIDSSGSGGSRVLNIDDGNVGNFIDVEIVGLTLTGGNVSGAGGGINNLENATVVDSIITGNASDYSGGGLNNGAGSLSVIRSTVSGNSSVYGGGIYNSTGGTLEVTASTVSGNVASISGGGLYNWFGYMTLSNSTVSGNAADYDGGGIQAIEGTLAVEHSTITGNLADADDDSYGQGGGIFRFGSDADLSNTIVAENIRGVSTRDDIAGGVAPVYSLIGDNSGTILTEAPVGSPDGDGNLIGGPINGAIDPRLGSLANNGGPTETHALLAGSPAIDAGDPLVEAPVYDQRGEPFDRVFDGDYDSTPRIDIGAFESNSFLVDTLVDESDGDYSAGDFSLREAIELANLEVDPATIEFDPLLAGGTILLTEGSELVITNSMSIIGLGANLLTVDASGNDMDLFTTGTGTRVFDVDDGVSGNLLDVSITGLTLTGGDEFGQGGAIRSHENLTLAACMVTGNYGGNGGGIYGRYGLLDVDNCVIDSNVSGAWGGGIDNRFGSLRVTNSTLSGNTGIGGGIHVQSNSTAYIADSMITDNGYGVGGPSGGGIYSYSTDLTLLRTTLSGNQSQAGGGLYLDAGQTYIADSLIIGNTVGYSGGGIFGTQNALTITRSIVSGNEAGTSGAGIFNQNATLEITESTISGNTAATDGGGIHHFYGDLSITSSTVSGNSTGYEGGGIRLLTTGTAEITNATISGNSAGINGGGIWARTFDPGASFLVAHSTITDNTADSDSFAGGSGGGIYFFFSVGTDEINHTVVAGNVRGGGGRDDIDGDVVANWSLVGDDTGASITGSDNLIGSGASPIDPLLDSLADNGGPTLTHALLPDSPAIDAGDPDFTSPPEYDQRGDPILRVMDGDGDSIAIIDIGAFELEPPAGPELIGDYNGDGKVSAADFTVWRDRFGAPTLLNRDPANSGPVDDDDFESWKEHYGEELPEGSGASSANGGGVSTAGPNADLVLNQLSFVDPYGNPVSTPVIGQKVFVLAEWTFSDLDFADEYVVRFTMDGVSVESFTIQGWPGMNQAYSWWHGGWIATPGSHTIGVTVDANDSISELNEANNTLTLPLTPAAVDVPSTFVWPVAGMQSVDWVIDGYVDTDPTPGFEEYEDYQGRGATYDGHNGIDIAIPNFAAMDAGVPVLAAASGTVTFVGDGDYDRWLSPPFPYPEGNLVIIDHGNGWQTYYFHLKRNSVTVSVGENVVAGQQIGEVGSSGYSLRPHLHFEVVHDNTPVEPFIAPSSYFVSPPTYTFDAPTKLLDFGITNVPPPFEDIAEHVSDIDTFPENSDWVATYSWAIFASMEIGDTWEVKYYRPNGALYSDFDPAVVNVDLAWQWSWWNTWLEPSADPGQWRAEWLINDVVVANHYFDVGPARPEIRIYRDNALDLFGNFVDEIVIDGRTTPINFGSADVGDPGSTITFTVENHGYADLVISGVSLPLGYAVTESLAGTIAAGTSDTFTVELETSSPGLKAGQIKVFSNDVSEPFSSFAVEGTVIGELIGDYNGDGKVGAADFTVWRDHFGAPTLLNRDPDNSGPVDDDDFDSWLANYGNELPEGSGAAAATEEDMETGRQGEGRIADFGLGIVGYGNGKFRMTNIELGSEVQATEEKMSLEELLLARSVLMGDGKDGEFSPALLDDASESDSTETVEALDLVFESLGA